MVALVEFYAPGGKVLYGGTEMAVNVQASVTKQMTRHLASLGRRTRWTSSLV